MDGVILVLGAIGLSVVLETLLEMAANVWRMMRDRRR
jgi:hypothetical protein